MRFTLSKEFRFEASHMLAHHDGKCARLHGHSWVFEIHVRGNYLRPDGPQKNMVHDYGDLGKVGDYLVECLDHQHLNEILEVDSPTSEYVAQWLYLHIDTMAQRSMEAGTPDNPKVEYPHDSAAHVIAPSLVAIVVRETCTTACRLDFE